MQTQQLATTIDRKVKKSLDLFCKKMGCKMNKFIEEAILAKLEDEQDSRDLTAAIRNASEFESLDELKARLKKAKKI